MIICQNQAKSKKNFNFYRHSHALSEPIRKIFILIFQGAGHCNSGLATFCAKNNNKNNFKIKINEISYFYKKNK